MIELAERCPSLRSVCVSNCSHLTDQVLWLGSLNIIIRKWLNHSHNLHQYQKPKSNRNPQSLVALASHCPSLVTLECAGLSHFTDAGFQVRPHHYHHFLIVEEIWLWAVISIIELCSLCIFGKDWVCLQPQLPCLCVCCICLFVCRLCELHELTQVAMMMLYRFRVGHCVGLQCFVMREN